LWVDRRRWRKETHLLIVVCDQNNRLDRARRTSTKFESRRATISGGQTSTRALGESKLPARTCKSCPLGVKLKAISFSPQVWVQLSSSSSSIIIIIDEFTSHPIALHHFLLRFLILSSYPQSVNSKFRERGVFPSVLQSVHVDERHCGGCHLLPAIEMMARAFPVTAGYFSTRTYDEWSVGWPSRASEIWSHVHDASSCPWLARRIAC
jgi:hypothetical protein